MYQERFEEISNILIGGYSEIWNDKIVSGEIDDYVLIQVYNGDDLLFEDNILNEPLYINWLNKVYIKYNEQTSLNYEVDIFEDSIVSYEHFILSGVLCQSQQLTITSDGIAITNPTC